MQPTCIEAAQLAGTAVGPGERWTLHEAREHCDLELIALFREVFQQEMSLAQWRWKYQHAPMRGLMLRSGSKPVAFFGGMPRAMDAPQGAVAAVQNGDVMVSPSERAVFTRQGALYQVAAAFFLRHVGAARDYSLDFGFPNERHFRLGARLGLYLEGGRMQALAWAPLPKGSRTLWHVQRALSAQELSCLEGLGQAMRRDWPLHLMPRRDAARWRWRYVDNPAHSYDLLVVRRRWGFRAVCALALREHADHVELLDYVGPRAGARLAVEAARRFAGARGGKRLTALVSQSIAGDFEAGAHDSQAAMPIAIAVGSDPAYAALPFWLMGGDTDFL